MKRIFFRLAKNGREKEKDRFLFDFANRYKFEPHRPSDAQPKSQFSTEETFSPPGHLNVSAMIGSLLLNQFLDDIEIYFVIHPQWKKRLSQMDSR